MGEVDADEVVAEVGDQRAVAERPSGAGERGAALGGHGGAHHGEQRQAPGKHCGGEQPPGRAARGASRRDATEIRRMTVSTRSALPRWIATDQGLLRSSTVRPPRAPWSSRSSDRARRRRRRDRGVAGGPGRQGRPRPAPGARRTGRRSAGESTPASPGRSCSRCRARPRCRRAAAPSGRSRSASPGRTGRSWWCARRHPAR